MRASFGSRSQGQTRIDHRRELTREDHDVARRDPRPELEAELLRFLSDRNRDQLLLMKVSEYVVLAGEIHLAGLDVAARRRSRAVRKRWHVYFTFLGVLEVTRQARARLPRAATRSDRWSA